MSFRFGYPVRSDFDSQEEYEYACEVYESAQDDYAEADREAQLESRFC